MLFKTIVCKIKVNCLLTIICPQNYLTVAGVIVIYQALFLFQQLVEETKADSVEKKKYVKYGKCFRYDAVSNS